MDLLLLTAPAPRDEITGGHRYNGEMVARAASHGARVRPVPLGGRTLPARAVAARRALRAAGGADAVIVDSIVAAPFAFAGRAGPRLVGLAHQIPSAVAASPLDRVGGALARVTYGRCALVIAVSPWVSARLRLGDVPRAVVEPGVEARRPLGAGDPKRILCVANWLPHKGVLELVEAFARLRADGAVLELAGAKHLDSSYGRRVAARIARADLAGRVVAPGTLTKDALARAYASAGIFALPARGEAYGIAFAEALASGLPVVGCRSGYVPALVGDAGLLVEPGDVSGLGRALALVLADGDRRGKLAAAARQRARALPTWEESASAFFAAIRAGTRVAPRVGSDERHRSASSA
jgi:glycosyltransferase involved in cell wall biosynthesis